MEYAFIHEKKNEKVPEGMSSGRKNSFGISGEDGASCAGHEAKKDILMFGVISRFMAEDHARLESLLQQAIVPPGQVEPAAYAEFRAGLLRHIAMEEKILLPAAQRLQDGRPLPFASRLRLDHGALAALLVPSLTPAIATAIRSILSAHNALEEGPGGLYQACDELAGSEAPEILRRLQFAPEVRVAPHVDGEKIIEATRRALARAGYDFPLSD